MKKIAVFALALLAYVGSASAQFSPGCGIGFCPHSSSGAAPPVSFSPSQRSIFNMYYLDPATAAVEYKFIDHIAEGGSGAGVFPITNGTYASPGYWWTNGNPTWTTGASNANLDAKGWPQNYTLVDANIGNGFGNHVYVPASSNYGAAVGHGYTIEWTGDCRVTFNSAIAGSGSITWSNVTAVNNPSGNFANNGNGDWSGTSIKLTANLTNGGLQGIGWRVTRTGHLTGSYCRDVKFYRQDDAADLAAGKIFRTPYKQIVVSQDPAAVRFMNWINNNGQMFPYRWEHKPPFPSAAYGGAYSQVALPYSDTSLCGATANQFCLAGVTGTPVSMQHGELVVARLGASITKSQAGGYTISTINKCATGVAPCNTTGQVVTNAAHPFVVGDPVVFVTSSASGMKEINFYNTTVTAVQDTTHFSTGIDTTSFTTFTSGYVAAYATLNVGSRGNYPIMDPPITTPITAVGSNTYFHANDIRTLYFDKTVFGSRDGSGNPVAGVWLTQLINASNPQSYPPYLGAPYELMAAFINEVNAMSPVRPIDLWMVVPATSLLSMDPDYSSGSDYSKNAFQTVKSALTDRHIFSEYSNEVWHTISQNFPASGYLEAQAYYRVGQPIGVTGLGYMHGLRAAVMANDLGTDSRLSVVLAGQGTTGIDRSAGQPNYATAFGGALYYADPVIQALPTVSKTGNTHNNTTIDNIGSTTGLYQGWGVACTGCPAGLQIVTVNSSTSITVSASVSGTLTGTTITFAKPPIEYHWGWATASYFDPPSTYYSTTAGTGNFTDDSAMYNGVDNSGALSMTGGTGGVSSQTLTTTAVASGTPVVDQLIVGTGIPAATVITAVAGSSPTYTLTLSNFSTVANGTTITSPANGGGNYIGAANQTQALVNFVAQVVGVAGGTCSSLPAGGETTNRYMLLTGCYSAAFSPAGKTTLQYEGAHDWVTTVGASQGGKTISVADQKFVLGVQASSQWSTAYQNFLTSYRSNALTYMPALYLMISQQWGYTSVNNATLPIDYYSGGVEGGALNTTWTTNGSVNRSISP